MNTIESNTLFVTGTDTGCGKTTVTALLARYLAGRGASVACFKPIASGCERLDGRLVSADAVELMDAMNVELDYDTVNPVALQPAIAPHIAAELASIGIDLDGICAEISRTSAEVRLVEGVGGWLVPLDADRLLPELAHRLQCPVILVVGMRLGCLNHALLTARAIAGDGFRLVGWVANYLDDEFEQPSANEATLDRMLPAPRLARAHRRGADNAELEPGPMLEAALRGTRPG
jgi:dethiobiotin synthetase